MAVGVPPVLHRCSGVTDQDRVVCGVNTLWEDIEMAECPECGAAIVEDPAYEEGEIVDCEDCGVELEVISEEPLEFALAPEEEEDWGQ